VVKIQKNIIIARPAQTIWAILDDPVQSSNLNPLFKLVYYYESQLGGYDRAFRCEMGGKAFEASSHMIVYECARHMAYRTVGAFRSDWHWWLESDGEQTHVSLTVDYSMALAEMDALTLQEEQAQAIETQLANLKRVAEARE
jgi:polyketide cyclase/dehydrase/lipid transport protein